MGELTGHGACKCVSVLREWCVKSPAPWGGRRGSSNPRKATPHGREKQGTKCQGFFPSVSVKELERDNAALGIDGQGFSYSYIPARWGKDDAVTKRPNAGCSSCADRFAGGSWALGCEYDVSVHLLRHDSYRELIVRVRARSFITHVRVFRAGQSNAVSHTRVV